MTWEEVPEVSDVGMVIRGWKPTRRNFDEYRRLTHWRTKNRIRFVKIDFAVNEHRVDDRSEQMITAVDVNRAKKHLKRRQWELLRLRYWEGLTHKEAGAKLGFNESRSCQIEKTTLKELKEYV